MKFWLWAVFGVRISWPGSKALEVDLSWLSYLCVSGNLRLGLWGICTSLRTFLFGVETRASSSQRGLCSKQERACTAAMRPSSWRPQIPKVSCSEVHTAEWPHPKGHWEFCSELYFPQDFNKNGPHVSVWSQCCCGKLPRRSAFMLRWEWEKTRECAMVNSFSYNMVQNAVLCISVLHWKGWSNVLGWFSIQRLLIMLTQITLK